mgnify:CR=1 FL=1|jgi:beta-1,4-mannosyltransferase
MSFSLPLNARTIVLFISIHATLDYVRPVGYTSAVFVVLLSIIISAYLSPRQPGTYRHVVVLVLGDIGRSPRMQYHAISLADMPNTRVSLIGYAGEKCVRDVRSRKNIDVYRLSPPSKNICPGCPFFIYAAQKVARQVLQLLWCLLVVLDAPDAVLVQNPPSIPTLILALFVCVVRGAKFVIDWHNFGYTILGLRLSVNHPLVTVSKWYERLVGRFADSSLCVTHAMKKWLKTEWGIESNVLHDRPPPFFRRANGAEKHKLFSRLRQNFEAVDDYASTASSGPTLFTLDEKTLREDRPLLAISSTSWTPDEDFGILLDAIVLLAKKAEDRRSSGKKFPRLVFVVTGKGPQRAMYEERIRQLQLSAAGIYIFTMWLESADYPLLLGSADLGICLHTSSSGLDLPMKVVDMFGCGLPVCAVGFKCLEELVIHNQNGYVFQNAAGLCDQMFSLFSGHVDDDSKELRRLGENVKAFQNLRWADNWTERAEPLFR